MFFLTHRLSVWTAAAGLSCRAPPAPSSLRARRYPFPGSWRKRTQTLETCTKADPVQTNEKKKKSPAWATVTCGYLKQSSTEPTTSSANSLGSLPVTLPMLQGFGKKGKDNCVSLFSLPLPLPLFLSLTLSFSLSLFHMACVNCSSMSCDMVAETYPLAADQRTMFSVSFSPNSRCSMQIKSRITSQAQKNKQKEKQ